MIAARCIARDARSREICSSGLLKHPGYLQRLAQPSVASRPPGLPWRAQAGCFDQGPPLPSSPPFLPRTRLSWLCPHATVGLAAQARLHAPHRPTFSLLTECRSAVVLRLSPDQPGSCEAGAWCCFRWDPLLLLRTASCADASAASDSLCRSRAVSTASLAPVTLRVSSATLASVAPTSVPRFLIRPHLLLREPHQLRRGGTFHCLLGKLLQASGARDRVCPLLLLAGSSEVQVAQLALCAL